PGVGDAHDDLVDPAAEIAGDDAERRADGAGDDHGREADEGRNSGAEDQSREDIAPEMIGAEQILETAAALPGGWPETPPNTANLRIMGRDVAGEDGEQGDREQDERRDPWKIFALQPG